MKKYRLLSSLLTVITLVVMLTPFSAMAAPAPALTARHAILLDANYDQVLHEHNAHEKAYPASITKVMTALLVCEALEKGELTQDQMITVSESALTNLHANGSTANLKAGETLSVKDLLYCLLIPSANEAANILAEAVSGSVEDFVTQMNKRAQELGCTGTHFANAHGLHNNDHYTSAYDIALFTKEALKHDLFCEIVGSKFCTIPATNLSEARKFYNTNALLSNWYYIGYTYDKAIGVKTGTTDEAGKCLVSAAKDGEEYMICVVLGTPLTREDGSANVSHFVDSKALLKWGFQNFQHTIITKNDEPVAQVNVTLSQEADCVMVKPVGEISRTLPVDLKLDDIQSTISLFEETVPAPITEGEVLGAMTLSYNGEVFGTLDLVAVNSVERSELLYHLDQAEKFFSKTSTKLILGVVLIAAIALVVKLFFFTKRRRTYSGRRRR